MKICVLGLGYIGLPTAAMFASRGFEVVGVDVSLPIVDRLNRGEVHIQEQGVQELVREALESGRLRARSVPERADVFILAVPTPLLDHARSTGTEAPEDSGEGRPGEVRKADLGCVIAAAESILPYLRPGNLVVLESTSPPRTTEDVLRPILERSGLATRDGESLGPSAGRIYAAYCPERVLPGRIVEELVGNDRIIGGLDSEGAERARDLYASFVKGELFVTDATTAEMVKLMENTYRDVNIALANEFAMVAERVGIDAWEAIRLANRHPRVSILRPGPGVGGHCIAVDPWFIAEAAPDVTPLIRTARGVNDAMPERVVERIERLLAERYGEGALQPANRRRYSIACLGLAYKADVDDCRESPAVEVVNLLQAAGFEVKAFDPYVRSRVVSGQVESLAQAISDADVVVVLTDHSPFRGTLDLLQRAAKAGIVDTRNVFGKLSNG